MVEYDYRGNKPFYVALALHDLRRGGIPFGDSFDLTESGHHTVHFHLPMALFNNGEFRITASMHTWDGSHASTAEMIAFTNENNSCNFSVRDKNGKDNYALINKVSMSYESLDKELATRQHPVEED